MPDNQKNIYTVSRLNNEVRILLERNLGKIWLNGEISNFSCPSSGHWYLTLKDHFSQVRCAMFKGKNRHATFTPINGQQVLVRANLSVYEPRGDYQLIIESILPAGDGLLAQQYEALKMKLAAQGLFANENKQALPKQIQRIGVITSPTGAAIRDVLHVLARRDPSLDVIIYPAQVQGNTAASQLVNAIKLANSRQEVDILLLTRGGGSLEDLWCFNDEQLAYAIFESTIPVLSAVGHEIDTSISDYVADLRAPTPSAAAELLSQDTDAKRQNLITAFARLQQGWQHYQLNKQQQITKIENRLQQQDPQYRLQQLLQYTDELQLRLTSSMNARLQQAQYQHIQLHRQLDTHNPAHKIKLINTKVTYLQQRLNTAINDKLSHAAQQLQHSAHTLQNCNPLSILARGYSISKNHQGEVIYKTEQLEVGDTLHTQLNNGTVVSRVEKVTSVK